MRNFKAWIEENRILEEQSGFRKGRGEMENVSIERNHRQEQKTSELFLVFFDIEKGYYSVSRGIKLLEHLGVDPKAAKILKNLYED